MLSSSDVQAQIHNVHGDEPIGDVRELYSGKLDPDIVANTARNIERLFPVRVIRRGDSVRAIARKDQAFRDFEFQWQDKTYDLFDYLALGRVSGLLVIHEGAIAYENYLLGNSEQTRWMSMSVAKSIAAALVGAAVRDGHIESVDDLIVRYLPRFENTAYDGVTVRQLLNMTSGVKWVETYTDPTSDRRAMLDAQISQQPGAILDLMAALPRAAEPGTTHNYSTGETHLVGALLEAAAGQPVSDYLSEKLWRPAGMEADASWWLDSPDGLEVAGSGISATLRDYARFGMFMLADGVIDGSRVLPEGWMDSASNVTQVAGQTIEYGYMLWPLGEGAYSAIGIFGQFVYVDPKRNVVIAMWSAQPKPLERSGIDEYVFLAALAKAVHNFYQPPD